jgi:O-antigen ligase
MGQLNPMVLIFTILALAKMRRSIEAATVDVLLPVLLLVPSIFSLRLPHLPPIFCYQAALYPIGIATLFCRLRRWTFRRADLWIVSFVVAAGYTDYLRLGLVTALFNFPGNFCNTIFPYFIGRLLIEQTGLRQRFAQRVVVLLSVVGFLSISEFVLRHNLFEAVANKFLSADVYWPDVPRHGFIRVKGPFAGAENAGIVFVMGLFLALWIWYINKNRKENREPRYIGLRRSVLWICGIALGLYMTLSRGPWLGAATGFLIAHIGLVKKRKRRIAVIIAIIVGIVGVIKVNQNVEMYTRLSGVQHVTEDQSSAAYRTQLYRIYKPIAQTGGMFGWSATAYPREGNFGSIDNEYLLLWVIQGKVGLSLFILLLIESFWGIIRAIWRSGNRTDMCFYFCLGGMLGGILVVISTVFIAAQCYNLFFLCIGWSQSLRDQFEAEKTGRRGPQSQPRMQAAVPMQLQPS